MDKSVLVFLAAGFETIEALAVVDIFRRAKITVVTAAVGAERQVVSSQGILVLADKMLEDCMAQEWDLLVLPGGIPGSENLADSAEVVELVRRQMQSGKLYGAICAAPAVVLDNCITGRGAGHAVAFALELLENLAGADIRKEVEKGLALG